MGHFSTFSGGGGQCNPGAGARARVRPLWPPGLKRGWIPPPRRDWNAGLSAPPGGQRKPRRSRRRWRNVADCLFVASANLLLLFLSLFLSLAFIFISIQFLFLFQIFILFFFFFSLLLMWWWLFFARWLRWVDVIRFSMALFLCARVCVLHSTKTNQNCQALPIKKIAELFVNAVKETASEKWAPMPDESVERLSSKR